MSGKLTQAEVAEALGGWCVVKDEPTASATQIKRFRIAHGQEIFCVDRRYQVNTPWEVIYEGEDSVRAIETYNLLS